MAQFPRVKCRQLLAALGSLGYTVTRQRGSHRILLVISFAEGDDVPPGVSRKVLVHQIGAERGAGGAMSATVRVTYHLEDGLWWAESPDVPEFVGGGDTLEQVRERSREGLELALDGPVVLIESIEQDSISDLARFTIRHPVSSFVAAVTTSSARTSQTTAVRPPAYRHEEPVRDQPAAMAG